MVFQVEKHLPPSRHQLTHHGGSFSCIQLHPHLEGRDGLATAATIFLAAAADDTSKATINLSRGVSILKKFKAYVAGRLAEAGH